MDLEAARKFMNENHRAVMATYRQDGRPQLSPVNVGVDAEGRAIISTREPSYKVRNLRRDPRVSLCVMNDGYFGEWIQIDGRVEIVPTAEAVEPLVDYYQRTWGEHPDWAEYRQAMLDEKRVLLRVHLERAGPDRRG